LRTVEVAGGGDLLLKRRASVASEPTLVVSLARSGESPESAAVVEMLLNEMSLSASVLPDSRSR
jgi:fructoselysine-6-P-deglycase FrlB-like protein